MAQATRFGAFAPLALSLTGCVQTLGLDDLSFEDPPREVSGIEPREPTPVEARTYPGQFGTNRMLVGRADALNDAPYLVYDPVTGEVESHRANADLEHYAVEQRWSWETRWSLVLQVPRLEETVLIGYDADFGLVDQISIDAEGTPTGERQQSIGTEGWSHLIPVRTEQGWHLLAYNSQSGHYRFRAAWPSLDPDSQFQADVWQPGWTTLTAYPLGESTYILKYNSDTGDAELEALAGSAADEARLVGNIGSGITSILSFSVQGRTELLVYASDSGVVRTGELSLSGGLSFVARQWTFWREGLTNIAQLELGSAPHAVTYNHQTGLGQVHALTELEPLPVY